MATNVHKRETADDMTVETCRQWFVLRRVSYVHHSQQSGDNNNVIRHKEREIWNRNSSQLSRVFF